METWIFVILWLLFIFFGGFGKRKKQHESLEQVKRKNKKKFRERRRNAKRGSLSKSKQTSESVWSNSSNTQKDRAAYEFKNTGNFWQDISDLAGQVRKDIDRENNRQKDIQNSTVSKQEIAQAVQTYTESKLQYGQSYDDVALSKNLHMVKKKEGMVVRDSQEVHAAKARAMRDKRLALEAELAALEAAQGTRPSIEGKDVRDLFYFKELIDKPLSLRR